MILTIKHKHLLYKRFEQDIWGYCFNNPCCELPKSIYNSYDLNELYKYKNYYHKFFFKLYWDQKRYSFDRTQKFIYSFNTPRGYRPLRKFNMRFISIRLTRLYFLTFQDHQFRCLFKKAKKMDGNFASNYLNFLECRILAFLYRINFHYDIFYLLNFTKKHNNIFINFKSINLPNTIISVGDFLTLNKKYHNEFKKIWLKRIKQKAYLSFFLPSAFVSYSLFFAFLMKEPQKLEFLYPFALDVQRITGYY